MLVAYGPEGQPVVAQEKALAQLQQWSQDHQLHCPNCRARVHIRGGAEKRMGLHFAHQRGECAWSTEGESVRHLQGKWTLAQWLQQQFPTARVTLEKRLPEPNRIADIFVEHQDNRCWSVEFQCAPLDIEEWRLRHGAYRKAGIIDLWIIGNNRLAKQEAFIEAILTEYHEILFLDPLAPRAPRSWLRWPITRQQALAWQDIPHTETQPALAGWVGRMGYGLTITANLSSIKLGSGANLMHPARIHMQAKEQLIQSMSRATEVDAGMLTNYLKETVAQAKLDSFLLPLLRAYQRDPELLWRYNYGRGQEQPVSAEDRERVSKAQQWVAKIAATSGGKAHLLALLQKLPFVGPYAAFARYAETLINITP